MQEALLGFMISEFHEHFIGIEIGNKPVPAADGYFTLRIPDLNDNGWTKLAKLMERDDLIQDPRFATAAARKQNRAQLYDLIKAWVSGKTRQELWDGLRAIDYFGAPVLSMGEVIDDPHIKERKAFIERNHPTAGPTTLLAPWIHMSKTPASIRTDSPALGQHTEEVLGNLLGIAGADLLQLRNAGVVK
jgi:crotonobetainyl-CoA:carnitine CoA-transferase CaiB-like acyl-CoA transferase